MNEDKITAYYEDLTQAVESMDLQTFKDFTERNKDLMPPFFCLATDEVLEITMRKIAVNLPMVNKDVKKEAELWLTSRGYDLSLT